MNVIKLHSDKPVTAANLVWEEPPTTEHKHGKYADFAQALRENPGRHAIIATFSADRKRSGWGLSNSINSGKLVDFRPSDAGAFKATCRSTGDECRVYVRFEAAAAYANGATTPEGNAVRQFAPEAASVCDHEQVRQISEHDVECLDCGLVSA